MPTVITTTNSTVTSRPSTFRSITANGNDVRLRIIGGDRYGSPPEGDILKAINSSGSVIPTSGYYARIESESKNFDDFSVPVVNAAYGGNA